MQYTKLNSIKDWSSIQDETYVAVDIETTGLSAHTDQIVNCGFYNGEKAFYTESVQVMRDILALPNIKPIFHNAVFDVSFLVHNGCDVLQRQIHDTMVLAHVLDCNDSGRLKDQATKYLGEDSITNAKNLWQWLKDNGYKKGDISKAPEEYLIPYVCEDVINTYKLFQLYCKRIKKLIGWVESKGGSDPWDYYLKEGCELIPVLVEMHLGGVNVDLNRASKKKAQLEAQQSKLLLKLQQESKEATQKAEILIHKRKTAHKASKNKSGKLKKPLPPVIFNWASNDHLKALFFDVLKTKPTKMTEKGNPAVDEDFLVNKESEFPWLGNLLTYRKINKLLSTYVTPVLERHSDNKIHANILITGTETGRFSCKNPNLQNLPRPMKGDGVDGASDMKCLYRPQEGHVFAYADYSQLELRIAAHVSQDPLLLKAYREGLDLHQTTTDIINAKYNLGVVRDQGKRLNFSIIYNASGFRIAEILGLMAEADQLRHTCGCKIKPNWRNCAYHQAVGRAAREGDKIGETLFGQYSGLKSYLDKQVRFMTTYKVNMSDYGRIRRLPDLALDPKADKKKYNHAVKAGFNHRIQSDGASICKRAMVLLSKEGLRIVNQIHDAIICEVLVADAEKTVDKMKEVMENVVQLSVPLIVEPKLLNSFNEGDVYD